MCKYYIKGKCNKGDNCPYMHSQFDSKSQNSCIEECPMYNIGYCKNGTMCHFIHNKKETYNEISVEEDVEEDVESVTSSTPLAEDFISEEENKNKIKNNDKINKSEVKQINSNLNNEYKEKLILPEIPIWYLERYYDKPISVIFSELEQKNLPEVLELQKKYNYSPESKNNDINIIEYDKKKSNTFNFNVNNFQMNFEINQNPNFYISNYNFNYESMYSENDVQKNNIMRIIESEFNIIYYYLLKFRNYDELNSSYETNVVNLPKHLYNELAYNNSYPNNLTIIIFIYIDRYKNFFGFAKLLYPVSSNSKKYHNLYKVEWLWKNKFHYSIVSHLMNKADNDRFLNEGRNGCPIDNDLGNFLCKFMINRLTEKEAKEFRKKKDIFEEYYKFNSSPYNKKYYKNEFYQQNIRDKPKSINFSNNFYYKYNKKYYYEEENSEKVFSGRKRFERKGSIKDFFYSKRNKTSFSHIKSDKKEKKIFSKINEESIIKK